ncbi:hypothetical protein GOP47_0003928 [Adiantum capillus-veneris]|uniref:GDSL esterase/lipase n=1 Tax=Adiantum capillus-veneris TaxID=13818 RepID=A0A9D4V6J7_ADICA|nr:hypothetical protein GOP47_0003928 [Adiantum capillus-veneris]
MQSGVAQYTRGRRASEQVSQQMADVQVQVAVGAKVVVALLIISCCCTAECGEFKPFPAYFIFGDSLVDAGNNNYITTVAKANNLPFGIDFPGGPTGRFTNGKTVTDVLCDIVSLPFPPPYLAPTTRGTTILQGVNYASAAAGIIRSTGYDFIGRVDIDTQLVWFSNTIKDLNQQLGESGTQELLKKSLFSLTVGANDYVNNYLLKGSPTSLQYNTTQFHQILLNKHAQQLTELRKMGARNIVVTSIGPIGCIPAVLARRSKNGECSEYVNNLAREFNAGLKSLIPQLNGQLPGSNFFYGETFDSFFNYRNNPQKYGFKYGDKACCGAGKFNGNVLCLPILKPCPDRDSYVFWDCFHPAEAANKKFAHFLFDSLKDQLLKSL